MNQGSNKKKEKSEILTKAHNEEFFGKEKIKKQVKKKNELLTLNKIKVKD